MRDMSGPRAEPAPQVKQPTGNPASMDVPGDGKVSIPNSRMPGTAAEHADVMSGVGGAATRRS